MKQLTPLDAVFLSMETPDTSAQIGGLAILDPATHPDFDFERFQEFTAERVALCPRFGWKVQEVPFGLDLPYWVDYPEFDAADHVHRAALPGPGGEKELSELAARLFAMPLDRSRPLWEMFLIEGLQGGRFALLWKINHCLMDGASGAGLVELLFDLSPEPTDRPPLPADTEVRAGEPASWLDMTVQGTRNAFRRRAAIGRQLVDAARAAIAAKRAGRETATVALPRASFNGFVGPRRAVAWSSVPLADVKDLKERFDVTVNDVLLALTSGSVRRYLEHRDELPEESLHALMPMSTRSQGDKTVGNQVREVAVHWATNVADPVERLLEIAEAATEAKQHAAEGGPNLIAVLAESLPPIATRLITRAGAMFADRVPLPGNAVFSNVRMTPVPMYVAGAKILSMVPMSVLAPTQGLNITAVTYCDEVHFGITADPDRVPEPWLLAEGVPKALGELQRAADGWETRAA